MSRARSALDRLQASLGREARGSGPPRPSGGAVSSRYDLLPPQPEVPDGWRTGPPDFVIIGAQKSGTTWWQGLIEEHPSVVRAPGQRRELHYFDHFWDRWPKPEDLERYRRYFPRPDGALTGEKTPGYLYHPWVAPMMAEAAPDARLIVLMRDPVERYVSGLGLLARAGVLKGEVGAGEIGMREHRITEAIDRGRYAAQIDWWLQHFARDRLLLLQYERCVDDPQAELTRSYAFLGIEDHEASAEEVSRTRKQATEHLPVPAEIRRTLATIYADDVRRLGELMPDLDRSRWPGVVGVGSGD